MTRCTPVLPVHCKTGYLSSPLGGKSTVCGQRFGEMEVWALESIHGALTLPKKCLTVKPDDVNGRTKMYKTLSTAVTIRWNQVNAWKSFNVLLKEIRSLGINIELEDE